MNLINSYTTFMLKPIPTESTTTGMEVVPTLLLDTLLWTSGFVVLFQAIPRVVKHFHSAWYAQLPSRKRTEFPSYVVCLVHHVAMVPWAWSHIYQDIVRLSQNSDFIDYAPIETVVAPFCLGYLLSDTLCYAIPEAMKGKFDYIIHHVLTSCLVVTTMFANGYITRFIPHLLACDTTNLFFNTAWLLRLAGYSQSPFVTVLELCFALAFLLCRVINMPMAFYAVSSGSSSLGIAKYSLLPIAMLQWYWFAKIAVGLKARLTGKNQQSSTEQSKKDQ